MVLHWIGYCALDGMELNSLYVNVSENGFTFCDDVKGVIF